MSFLFENRCFQTVQSLHDYVAAACPVISNGAAINCQPISDHVQITSTNLITSVQSTYSYIPEQITCDPSITDLSSLLWQASLILVAGFGIRVLVKAIFQ